MFSEKDGKSIIEEHHKNAQFSSVAEFTAAKKDYRDRPMAKVIEAKPYVYEELMINFEGPEPPINEESVSSRHFNKHIRPAEEFEKAAGYVESIGALRALQEAMSGLYFDQF